MFAQGYRDAPFLQLLQELPINIGMFTVFANLLSWRQKKFY